MPARIAEFVELEPGDVIRNRDTRRRRLQARTAGFLVLGDVVELSIAGTATLAGPVVVEGA